MEELPANLFDNPIVEVAGYQADRLQLACLTIFGRLLTPEEFAELISAPNGSELLIEARREDTDIELKLGYTWFNGTHDYLVYVDADTGARVIEFENIANQAQAPERLETLLFAHQVQSFRKFGLDEIRLYAEGYAGHPGGIIGYYVWARFGFVMSLDGFGPRLAEAEFEYADTTIDLFRQEKGAEWWYNHGSERAAVFYLEAESVCSVALAAYLEEKGINTDGEDN